MKKLIIDRSGKVGAIELSESRGSKRVEQRAREEVTKHVSKLVAEFMDGVTKHGMSPELQKSMLNYYNAEYLKWLKRKRLLSYERCQDYFLKKVSDTYAVMVEAKIKQNELAPKMVPKNKSLNLFVLLKKLLTLINKALK